MPQPSRTNPILAACLLAPALVASETPGWQGLESIRCGAGIERLRVADCDGDGRDEVLLVDRRQARIDVLDWSPPATIEEAAATGTGPGLVSRDDRRAVNRLPLPPGVARRQLVLDRPPIDLAVLDNGDLVVLTESPDRLCRFRAEGASWRETARVDLLPGVERERGVPLLHLADEAGERLLVATLAGVQTVAVTAEGLAAAAWLRPRDGGDRRSWWTLDLDGDGQADTLEWTDRYRATVRVATSHHGHLQPAQAAHHDPLRSVVLLPGQPPVLATLDPHQRDTVALWRLERAAAETDAPLALALPGGRSVMTGILLEDGPALLAADAEGGEFVLHRRHEAGWGRVTTFPCPRGVTALAPVPGRPGEVLVAVDDAGDLFLSRFQAGRLTFPQAWHPGDAEPAGERRLLALAALPGLTWWIQRQDQDLVLYRWHSGEDQPQATVFSQAGADITAATWIGGDRLVAKRRFKPDGLLIEATDGQAEVREAGAVPALRKVDLSRFLLLPTAEGWVPARLEGGLVQWLDDHLVAIDQAGLGDGRQLAAFLQLDAERALAIDAEEPLLHHLTRDQGGVWRSSERSPLPGGRRLGHDPVLGPWLREDRRAWLLGRGRPWRLVPEAPFAPFAAINQDGERIRPSRLLRATARSATTFDLLVTDDRRHHLALVALERTDGRPVPRVLAVWPVFEDGAYPYGGDDDDFSETAEPRAIAAGDLDGRGSRELVMLIHDRVLVYRGQEAKP